MTVTFLEYPDPIVWWQVALWLVGVTWGSVVIGLFGIGGGAIFVPTLLFLPGMEVGVAVGTVMCGACPMSLARAVQLILYGHMDFVEAAPMMVGAVFGALAAQAALPHVWAPLVLIFVSLLTISAGINTHRKIMAGYRTKNPNITLYEICFPPNQDEEPPEGKQDDLDAPQEYPPQDSTQPITLEASNVPKQESSDGEYRGCFTMCESGQEGGRGSSISENNRKSDAENGDIEENSAPEEEAPVQLDDTDPQDAPDRWKPLWMGAIGLVAAFLSSISGTGGPLILFPVFMFLKPEYPIKSLMGLTSPFACAMVTTSVIGAALFGNIDVGLGAIMAVFAITGALTGGCMMERFGDSAMRLGVGFILVTVGIAIAIRTGVKLAQDYS